MTTKKALPDPVQDGITHINVYSQAKTELGRLLSNFAHTPFDCADGHFESVEGYWYWLTLPTHPDRDRLRHLHGFLAKQVGRELASETDVRTDQDREFREKIYYAFKSKLDTNGRVRELLKDSTLPFQHYYVYGSKVILVSEYDWLLVYWDSLRTDLQD